MADAAVEFLLNNLKDLLVHHSHLITDTRSQIESLERDLRVFRTFLEDSVKERRKDATTQALIRIIRDVVYEVEDVIDEFVTTAAVIKPRSYFVRAIKSSVNLHTIGEKVKEVTEQIKQRKIDFASLTVADEDRPEKSEGLEHVQAFESGGATVQRLGEASRGDVTVEHSNKARLKNFVGFEEETNEVIGYLTKETDSLDVITLFGMPGIGKTTLAWKIFNDPAIVYEFPTRIWVRVSEELIKNVFLTILREFTIITKDVMNRSEEELKALVVSFLEGSKFLIVFDDVWSISDWESLQIALPEHNKKGKVLITSRNEAVGRHAKRITEPRKVRFMSEEESWELLQLQVFGETDKCPPELEIVGELIAKQCDGLPLAIEVMGGVLLGEDLASKDIKAQKAAWIRACQAVPEFRNKKFYDTLPNHLKVCFLYLAAFPYDFEIPVGRLILMWIAEGFVVEERRGNSLEETAESYLEDLINRNLLQVSKIKANRKAKTCYIHRMLHEFCKAEAGYLGENLLTEINYGDDDGFRPPIRELEKCRRLSIHSNVLNFISSKPSCPCLRSLVSFSKDKISLPAENNSAFQAAFKLIRVLDVEPIIFPRISSDFFHLVHLRHLALSLNRSALPSKFSQLWNIQTLLVDTTSRTLEIKADIFKFTHLRHFKTNASAHLARPGKTSTSGENLQSLGMLSAESCTDELFLKAHNLKKLGIRGRLSLFFEGKTGSIDKLTALHYLENLKLLNDVYPHPPSEGRLRGLLKADKFPPSLKSLTLANTYLAWDEMRILGLLENLEVLKLKDNAFKGRIWKADDGGFPNLEALHIEETNLAIWVASAHHFPKLRSLKLRYCEQLQEVPIKLAEIPSLQLLELFETRLAAASAKRLQRKKEKRLKESNINAKEFMLAIYPPFQYE